VPGASLSACVCGAHPVVLSRVTLPSDSRWTAPSFATHSPPGQPDRPPLAEKRAVPRAGREWGRVRWVIGGRPAWRSSWRCGLPRPQSLKANSSRSTTGGWHSEGIGCARRGVGIGLQEGILDLSSAGEERRLHGGVCTVAKFRLGGLRKREPCPATFGAGSPGSSPTAPPFTPLPPSLSLFDQPTKSQRRLAPYATTVPQPRAHNALLRCPLPMRPSS
jgi:hypothetical protein